MFEDIFMNALQERMCDSTKCQFQMEKGQDNTANGLLAHLPSRRAYSFSSKHLLALAKVGVGLPCDVIVFPLVSPSSPVRPSATGKQFMIRGGAALLNDVVQFIGFAAVFSFLVPR
jgi:hypothetical protein